MTTGVPPTANPHIEGSIYRAVAVLRRELETGCSDVAVIGGLDLFITRLAVSVPQLNPPRNWAYTKLSATRRKVWLEAAVNMLEKIAQHGSNHPAPVSEHTSGQSMRVVRSIRTDKKRNALSGDAPVSNLRFFPTRFAMHFKRLLVNTVEDVLWIIPTRYEDYSHYCAIAEMSEHVGSVITVEGRIVGALTSAAGGPPGATVVTITDTRGTPDRLDPLGSRSERCEIVWFRQPYLARQFARGKTLIISGEVILYKGKPRMQNPEYELLTVTPRAPIHVGRLLPVYPSTEGLSQRTIRNVVRRALDSAVDGLRDCLPEWINQAEHLPTLARAMEQIHYPDDETSASKGLERLAFQEVLLLQIAALRQREEWRSRKDGIRINEGTKVAHEFIKNLGFTPTDDQQAALNEMLADMDSVRPMARLLQGEVGSGKTVVALGAMLAAAVAGYQSALMAPTEILAEQHFLSTAQHLKAQSVGIVDTLLEVQPPGYDRTLRVGLLTGSLSAQKKRWMQDGVRNGAIDMLIGTHSLLQDTVVIPNLALVVVDEQHRFGIEQRDQLAQRTPRPHMLAMSATPIPRTMQLAAFGDLEISSLHQMPRGRRPITTHWGSGESEHANAYDKVREEVAKGRQAFIVCPFIDESDKVAGRSVTEEFKALTKSVFPDLHLGLLHGRMSFAERQRIMYNLRDGTLDVLVSTPVVEVGVDIPNATVMLIESANRFGLAQLHQLRGRVGRGEQHSWCFALTDADETVINLEGETEADSDERLNAFAQYTDGFELSEADLNMRGPGDYVGTRQSGWMVMRVAKPWDEQLMRRARNVAKQLLHDDPQLQQPQNAVLLSAWQQFEERLREQPA